MAYKGKLYREDTDLKKPSLFKKLMNWMKSDFRRKKVFDLDVKRDNFSRRKDNSGERIISIDVERDMGALGVGPRKEHYYGKR